MSTRRLTWPDAGEAMIYRVNIRNEDTGERRTVYEGPDLGCALPEDVSVAWGLATYRVEARPGTAGEAEYETTLPYTAMAPLGAKERVDDMLHGAEIEGGGPYLLVVKDVETGRRVVEYWSERPRFRVPAVLEPGRKYQYRLACQQGAEVKDITRFRAVSPDRIAAARARAGAAAPAVEVASAAGERVKPGAVADLGAAGADGAAGLALVAIDVSVDLALAPLPDPDAAFDAQVLGRVPGGPAVGLEFILERAAAARLRPTVFLDVFAEHAFGRARLEQVIEIAATRKADVQLLLRPWPNLRFAADAALAGLARATAGADAAAFERLVAAAVELFQARVGRAPVAVRLADDGLTDAVFPALARNGLTVHAGAAAAAGLSAWLRARTRPCVGPAGVVETPPTRFLSLPAHPYDSAILSSLRVRMSAEAEETALRERPAADTPVVLTLSPQDLLFLLPRGEEAAAAWNAAASGPAGGEPVDAASPVVEGRDEIAIEALERVLRRLSSRRDLKPATFAELARDHLAACVRDPLGWDPIIEHHRGVRRGRVTAVRRYSADYLAALEGGSE